MKRKNNKENRITSLNGTPKEQAAKLLEILKDRNLDLEMLKELLPANVDIIKEFITCLKSDLNANQAAYGKMMSIFESTIQNLNGIIKDGKISKEEKKICLDEIYRLHQLMVDAHNKHEENQKDFWKRIMGYVTFIIGIIIVLAGKGKNPNKV